MKIETILVATDFSSGAEKAFEMAIQFAENFGSRIELLHIYHLGYWVTVDKITFVDAVESEIRSAVVRKLHEWAARAKAVGIEITTHSVQGTPSESIVERARDDEVDLIVLGTRGHSGLKHVLLGSVAERTVRRAGCPVLTVAG